MTPAEVTELEQRLCAMTHREVRVLYNQQEPESEEADVIAEYMRQHHIDD